MEPSELVHERLWHGRIPVVFSLHPSEVTTLHAPRPFYVRPSACRLCRSRSHCC